MTWDELLGKVREGLGESNAHLRTVGNLLATADEASYDLSGEQIRTVLAILTLGMSNIHSAVGHMSIGLDAAVEAMREASKLPEVKRD